MKMKKGTGNREQGIGGFLGGIVRGFLAAALCAVGLAAFADDPQGSKEDPWLVGSPNEADVEAWTNGMGRLDIDGEGAMMGFSASSPAPWAGGSVTEAVVGSNVTVIGACAFKSCPNLKTLVLNEQTPPTLGENNELANVKIFVPAGKAGDYRTSGDWAAYADAIEEMRSVKGKELTKHLYEMTYSWWDATKANDIGEMLAAYMAQPAQLAENGMSVPHAIPAWFGELRGAPSARAAATATSSGATSTGAMTTWTSACCTSRRRRDDSRPLASPRGSSRRSCSSPSTWIRSCRS